MDALGSVGRTECVSSILELACIFFVTENWITEHIFNSEGWGRGIVACGQPCYTTEPQPQQQQNNRQRSIPLLAHAQPFCLGATVYCRLVLASFMFHYSLRYSILVCLHGLTVGSLHLLWVLLQKHLLASSQAIEWTKLSLPLLFLFGRPVPSLHCAVMTASFGSQFKFHLQEKVCCKIKLWLFWLPSEFVEQQMGERRDFCSCLEVTIQLCHRGWALHL